MLAAHYDFFDDPKLLEVDESKRLFNSGRFVDALDGANDFAERREVLWSIIKKKWHLHLKTSAFCHFLDNIFKYKTV